MDATDVLLIGRDATLIDAVGRLARDVGRLGVAVADGVDAAYAFDGWDRIALVVAQVGRRDEVAGVIRLFRMLSAARRPVATVVLGDGLDEATEADLLRRGAADYLPRPFDLDRLAYLIDVLTLRARRPDVTPPVDSRPDPEALALHAGQVARLDATVLIHGGSGADKSRLARIIHDLSPRREGPFVVVRCGSLPDIGDEPDPIDARFAEAREGTLVLADVDALAPRGQAALLRRIEDDSREARASAEELPPRPRLIATSRLPLAVEAEEGRFRSDLFFRLNVIGFELPTSGPRPRPEAVPADTGEGLGVRSVILGPEAIAAMESRSGPGWGGGDEPGRDDHPHHAGVVDEGPSVAATLAQAKRDAERARIAQALAKNGDNRARTAGELGISRMTLYKKMYQYGIAQADGVARRRPHGRRVEASGPGAHPRPAPADSSEAEPDPGPRPPPAAPRGAIARAASALH